MNKNNQQSSAISEISNKDLIITTISCLQEIQKRSELRECLTEQTYVETAREYAFYYENDCFKDMIDDFKNYLQSKNYVDVKNKQERR